MYPELFHFEIAGITITLYMYGLMIALGVIAAISLFWWLCHRGNVPEKVYNFYSGLALVSIGIGFFGAWAFQQIYEVMKYGAAYKVTGSITFMGGLVFGVTTFVLGVVIFGKPAAKNYFYRVAGYGAPCVALAHAFGRMGCFFGGCCYGIENEVFGLHFPSGSSTTAVLPTMLYEAIFLFALCGTLMLLLRHKKVNLTLIVYGLSYSVWRFLLEFIRGDESRAVNGFLSPSQWQSVILFLVAAALGFFVIYLKKIPLYNPLFVGGTEKTDTTADTDILCQPNTAESETQAAAINTAKTSAARKAAAETELIRRLNKLESLESMVSLATKISWLFFIGLALAGIFAVIAIILFIVPTEDTTPLGIVFLLVAAAMAIIALLDYLVTPRAAILYDSDKQEIYIDKRCSVTVSPKLPADESLYFVIPRASIVRAYAENKMRNDYKTRTSGAPAWLRALLSLKVNAITIQTGYYNIVVHNILDLDAVLKINALNTAAPKAEKNTEAVTSTSESEITEAEIVDNAESSDLS